MQSEHGTRSVSSWHSDGEGHARMLLVRREYRHTGPAKDGEELRKSLRRRGDAGPDGGHQGHILFTTNLGIDVSVRESSRHALLHAGAATVTAGIDDVGHAAAG